MVSAFWTTLWASLICTLVPLLTHYLAVYHYRHWTHNFVPAISVTAIESPEKEIFALGMTVASVMYIFNTIEIQRVYLTFVSAYHNKNLVWKRWMEIWCTSFCVIAHIKMVCLAGLGLVNLKANHSLHAIFALGHSLLSIIYSLIALVFLIRLHFARKAFLGGFAWLDILSLAVKTVSVLSLVLCVVGSLYLRSAPRTLYYLNRRSYVQYGFVALDIWFAITLLYEALLWSPLKEEKQSKGKTIKKEE